MFTSITSNLFPVAAHKGSLQLHAATPVFHSLDAVLSLWILFHLLHFACRPHVSVLVSFDQIALLYMFAVSPTWLKEMPEKGSE